MFELISRNIGLVFSMMEHDTPGLFCWLARDCNYREEKLRHLNFESGFYCTRQNIAKEQFRPRGHIKKQSFQRKNTLIGHQRPESGFYCTRQNIVFKAFGRFWSFLKVYMYIQIKTFLYTIMSHKISNWDAIAYCKRAIQVKSSNEKVKFPAKNTLIGHQWPRIQLW